MDFRKRLIDTAKKYAQGNKEKLTSFLDGAAVGGYLELLQRAFNNYNYKIHEDDNDDKELDGKKPAEETNESGKPTQE